MKRVLCGCAIGALCFGSPLLAQDAAASGEDKPPINVTPVPAPVEPAPPRNMRDGSPVMVDGKHLKREVPPPLVQDTPLPAPIPVPPPPPVRAEPAPSRSTSSRLSQVPPTNIAAPYPQNQLPVTQLIGTEQKIAWRQSPAVFLPGLADSGRSRVVEGETMVKVPLHWAASAYLKGEVTIQGIGKPISLKMGNVLPQVVMIKDRDIDSRFVLFCTRSRIHQKDSGDWLGSIMDSMRDAQWCLQDTDSDGKLDLAVAIAAGAPVTKAEDITPVEYEMRYGQRIPGNDSYVQFGLNHVGRKDISILLSVVQAGETMAFQTMTSGIYSAQRITNIRHRDRDEPRGSILGVAFRVHEALRKENLAEIEWGPSLYNRSAIIPIPVKLTTTIRYY